jgi:hypothetical protein
MERRIHTRTDLSWPVSIWAPTASSFYYGRTANISKTGVFVETGPSVSLRPGETIELNFPRTLSLAQEKGQFARIKTGKVVRIERSKVLNEANLGVAVQFS